MSDNLKIKVQAELDRTKSKANISNDVKTLENTPFFIRLIGLLNKGLSRVNIIKGVKEIEKDAPTIQIKGRLNRSATRRNIRADVQSIGNDTEITLNARVNQQELERSVETAINNVEQNVRNNPINIPVNVNGEANNNAQQLQELNNQVRNTRGIFNDYLTARDILRIVVNSIKVVINTVNDLKKAETDLSIATSKSASEMKALMADYNQLAKDMSSTTLDVSEAANDFLRQGKSVAETNELIKDSLILSKIGQIESAQSTEYLTSAMKGFKVESKDAIKIVDKLSAVDLQSASSAGGLAEAMSKCANSAYTAGISMDSLIGYIATVAEVTQKSDSVVGESFKTIIARMGKIKLNNWIDEDGNDISGQINDVEKTLSRFGIALRESATEFRDFENVIYDVGMAWENFSSVDKNAIANAFGGVYQRENVITLFNNFSRALELTEASANSANTALSKFSIYENSLEAATNRLTASFEGLAYNTIDSDFLKGLANTTAEIVKFVDSTQLLKTGLSAALFTGVIAGLTNLGVRMVAVRNNVFQFTQAMNLSRTTSALSEEEYRLLLNSVNRLTQGQLRLVLSSRQLTEAQRLELMGAAGIEQARQQQLLQTWRLTAATNAQTASTFSLRGAWEALKLSIATNPIGLVVTALTTAVTLLNAYNQAQEEAIRKARESANSLDELKTSLTGLVDEYTDIINSEQSEIEKLKSLEDWKRTIADVYNIEKENLSQLNLERENGIILLEKEIRAAKERANLEWIRENKGTIDSVKNKFEHTPRFNQDGYSYIDGTDSWTGVSSTISQEIKNLFDKSIRYNDFTIDFQVDADNAIEEYDKLNNILTEIDKISMKRPLSESEQLLYNDIQKQVNYLKSIMDNKDLYEKIISVTADINFEEYLQSNEEQYKNLGKDGYVAWRDGLIATAEGDSVLEKQLLKLAEEQFPDYAKYFNNLETAKKMFMGGANPNSGYTARIKSYLESLSDEDLEIATKIPDLFANGLEGAAAKIKEWKTNPDNTIEPTVNTKPVDELVKEVSDKTKLIKSAMEDLNDTGHISSSTYAEIVEMGGNFIECLELQNGQLTLNIEKLKDLETQEYKNAIAANNLAIAELQMNINSGYDYLRIKEKVDDLKEQNALYTTLIEEIYNTAPSESNSKSSSSVTLPEEYTKLKKALEHEYAMGRKTAKEYYTELNSLAIKWLKDNAKYADEYMSVQETVYSGLKSLYSEVVNEQIEGYENVLDVLKNINQEKIDSLNKEKELLEDNADEEQRILDLKKAQLDLENAKKRTTWVITEQGLKQVQDEKGVKEAQDALDKLELESKTSQIDKKIKALEDENDKYDKIKTDWQNKTNFEEAKKFIGSDNIKGAVSEGFKEGYINALNEKQSIENADKSTNKVSNPVTIDDFLKKLGSKYTFEEIKDKAYNLAFSPYAFNSFVDNIKTTTDNIVNNINNNNSSKIGDINIVINDATDPEKVGNVVVEKLTDIATKLNNRIK